MPIDRSDILAALARLQLPDGGDLVSCDFIRAVVVDGEAVRFVIERTPEIAHSWPISCRSRANRDAA